MLFERSRAAEQDRRGIREIHEEPPRCGRVAVHVGEVAACLYPIERRGDQLVEQTVDLGRKTVRARHHLALVDRLIPIRLADADAGIDVDPLGQIRQGHAGDAVSVFESGGLEPARKIGRPCRRTGDPSEGQTLVALADLLDQRVGLAFREPSVAAEVREGMRQLRDPPAQARDAKVLAQTSDGGQDEERGFDGLDEVALGDDHATSDRSARRTSSRARVTL